MNQSLRFLLTSVVLQEPAQLYLGRRPPWHAQLLSKRLLVNTMTSKRYVLSQAFNRLQVHVVAQLSYLSLCINGF